MTSWSRAAYGALIGAVLTLLVHPVSRPFVAGPFIEASNLVESQKFSLPTTFPDVLPQPTDDMSASLWIHVGAEQVRNRSGLSRGQLEGLVRIARFRSERDPANAFWPIAMAIFTDQLDRNEDALAYWMFASKRLHYNDFQSRYLSKLRDEIGQYVATNSWQYAYCYRLRSLAFSYMVEGFARKLVSKVSQKTLAELQLRFATLENGGLLRDGSRNLDIMERGVAIVEVASHPRELQREPSIRRLLIAHSEFKESLRRFGLTEQANEVDIAYNENDGWSALTRREDTDQKVANLTLFSALWPNLPGVMLQCALIAAAIGLLGIVLETLARKRPHYSSVLTGVLAASISGSVFIFTQSWLAMLASALCCLFVLLTPRNPRLYLPQDLGPLFAFTITVLSVVFVVVLGVMFLTRTLPVQVSANAFDPYFASLADPSVTAGLSLIILSCVFLFAPLWALAQHVRTLFVLARGFRSLAIVAGTMSLILSVASTPLCVHFESENQETFRMLMENEPVYYVRQ